MPTKRTRVSRTPVQHVTPRAVELYRRGKQLKPIRDACVRSKEMCTHAECDELKEIQTGLWLEFKSVLRPWLPSPLDDLESWEPESAAVVKPIKEALEAALRAKP